MLKIRNMKYAVLSAAFAVFTPGCSTVVRPGDDLQASVAANGVDHLNLFIGTGFNGHTFPSATVPFGSVAPGPDCSIRGWQAASGYHYDKPTILGFSQTHLSGTGLIEWGDFMLMPTVGKIQFQAGEEDKPETGYRSRYSHADETATAGYYQVRLLDLR